MASHDVSNDPFLTHTAAPVAKGGGDDGGYRRKALTSPPALLEVAFVPALALFLVSVAFMTTYYFAPSIPWLMVLLCLMLVSWGQGRANNRNADMLGGPKPMASYHDVKQGGGRMTGSQKYTYQAPTYMGLVGVVIGVVLGLWLYENFMASFWSIALGPWYTNALADNPAGTYGDAGAISFSESSMIDTTKAVGYQHQKTYCAAPVLGHVTQPDQNRVNYWVVGTDCCGPRRSFWCDEAGNPETHWAIQEPPFSWLSRHDRAGYELAIRQAESFFDLTSDPNRMMLRWVKKPSEVQVLQITWVAVVLGLVTVGFFFFGIIVSLVIAMNPFSLKE